VGPGGLRVRKERVYASLLVTHIDIGLTSPALLGVGILKLILYIGYGSATWYTTYISSTVLTTVLYDPLLL
jgi:hypothetical protein